MDNFIVFYLVFTYGYMASHYASKVKGESFKAQLDGLEQPLTVTLLIGAILWVVSPVTFIFHVIGRVVKALNHG